MAWDGFLPKPVSTAKASLPADEKRRLEKTETSRHETETAVVALLEKEELLPWVEGVTDLKIPDEDVRRILAEIDAEYSGSFRRWAVNFLVRGLERGKNELGWHVRVPSRVVALALPSPPIRPKDFHHLQLADLLRAEFIRNRIGRLQPDAPVKAADILFSAIAYAGIIHQAKLMEFVRNAHLRLFVANNKVWVDWKSASPEDAWSRIILDPITASLLLRWHAENLGPIPLVEKIEPKIIWREIQRSLPLRQNQIKSLKKLLQIFSYDWSQHFPPWLYYWARGEMESVNLPSETWYRVLARMHVLPEPEYRETDTDQDQMAETVPQDADPDVIASMQKTRIDLRGLLRKEKKTIAPAIAVARLRQVQSLLPEKSLDWLLAGWLIRAMTPKHKGGQGIRVSSARTQLARIDRILSVSLKGQSPLDVEDEWPEFLENLLESVSAQNRRNIAGALHSFQNYLEDMEFCTPCEVDFGVESDSKVDANLLSEQEFGYVLRLLEVWEGKGNTPALQVAAILGRRACLRRGDVHGLRLSDILGNALPLLIIRNNPYRQLKSRSAMRQMPLADFCTQAEFDVVMSYVVACRQSAIATGRALKEVALFPDKSQPELAVSPHSLFDPIERSMRKITGDDSMRFHHLRHAAINYNILCAQEDLVPGTSILLDAPFTEKASCVDPARLRMAMVGDADPSRPRLWGVAIAAGHATPEVTLGSYFHLCDWVQHLFVCQRYPLFDELTASLAGISIVNLRVKRHRHGDEASSPVQLILNQYPALTTEFIPPGHFKPMEEIGAMIANMAISDESMPLSTVQGLIVLNELAECIAPRSLANPKHLGNRATKSKTRNPIPRDEWAVHICLVAAKFQLAPNILQSWWDTVVLLDSLRGIGPANSRHRSHITDALAIIQCGELELRRPLRLPLPVLRRDDEMHAATFDALFRQIAQTDPELLRRFLTIFWRCRNMDTSEIRTGSVEDAVLLHSVLKQLKDIPGRVVEFQSESEDCQLIYSLHPSPQGKHGDDQGQLRYWAESLDLELGQILLRSPMKQGRASKPDDVLVISLHFSPEISTSGKQKRRTKNYRTARPKQISTALEAATYIATVWIVDANSR